MTELWELGAGELAAAIRDREVSSREVVDAHLARIDAVNPALNAIVRRVRPECRSAPQGVLRHSGAPAHSDGRV